MPQPKPSDFPRIRGALTFYIIASNITGVLLLLLLTEMVLKYGFGHELELGGAHGFLALVPNGTVAAVNASTGILIVHGWFYVVYLFACFRLWSFMRWPFWRFLVLASGGIVPVLSFVLESRYPDTVRNQLAEIAATGAAA